MKRNLKNSLIGLGDLNQIIHFVRGHKVILDQDLAMLYGVETKKLNEQVKRNVDRFPDDFMFRLTKEEFANLRSHFATSSCEEMQFSSKESQRLRSHFATSNVGRGGRRYLPRVFTEHGVLMAANVLKSKQAISVSIQIVRAFVRLREVMNS